MKQALILIDIQNTYFEENGMLLHEPEKAAANAAKVLEWFRSTKQPVIFVQHNFEDYKALPGELDLNAIHEMVAPRADEVIVKKNYPSSFLKTDLKSQLDRIGAEQLVIIGDMSHMCVDTTVRAAMNYGYSVIVIDDACTTMDLKYREEVIPAATVHKTFMASLQGIFAQVMMTTEFLL